MSATIELFKYEPIAYEIWKEKCRLLNSNNFDEFERYDKRYKHFDVFERNYHLMRLRSYKSKTVFRFFKTWEDRFIMHENEFVLPVKRVYFGTHRSIQLKKRWFKRLAWQHIITTKNGLEKFMKQYVCRKSYLDFRKSVVDKFIEGEMFLHVSY